MVDRESFASGILNIVLFVLTLVKLFDDQRTYTTIVCFVLLMAISRLTSSFRYNAAAAV